VDSSKESPKKGKEQAKTVRIRAERAILGIMGTEESFMLRILWIDNLFDLSMIL